MDIVYLHLITNHVPIIGFFFGIIVLIYGLFRKSPSTIRASYCVLGVASLIGLIAYFSGNGAERAVKYVPGMTTESIAAHEEMAAYALVSYIILALLSLIGFVQSKNYFLRMKSMANLMLLVSTISFVIGCYTGFLGAQIRHTELRQASDDTIILQDSSWKEE